eukprot:6207612-Pleurochrysis_carterae.AAC.1
MQQPASCILRDLMPLSTCRAQNKKLQWEYVARFCALMLASVGCSTADFQLERCEAAEEEAARLHAEALAAAAYVVQARTNLIAVARELETCEYEMARSSEVQRQLAAQAQESAEARDAAAAIAAVREASLLNALQDADEISEMVRSRLANAETTAADVEIRERIDALVNEVRLRMKRDNVGRAVRANFG